MATLSFKHFLRILSEDLEQEVSKIQQDIAMLDAQITQRSKPLQDRKAQLMKLLATKQKQQQAQAKTQQPVQAAQPGQNATQTTTPGSSGSNTPGV